MSRLVLPDVTLCAVTSVNVAATVEALHRCVDQAQFADCLLLTDAAVHSDRIRTVAIPPLVSSEVYSDFLLGSLADFIATSHCLIVQWDGFIIDAAQWDDDFLAYDYIGAPWPHFADGKDVGNGGFSLRSRKLLDACRDPEFRRGHPEDVAIGRLNRSWLETARGIRFANRMTAERFSFERELPGEPTFGFHGIFNMIPVLGAERFWQIYRTLDERTSALVDYRLLMQQLGGGPAPMRRRYELTKDRVAALIRR